MPKKVVVTGIGIASSAGLSPEEVWNNIMDKRRTVATDPRLAGTDIDWACSIRNWAPSEYLKKSLIWRCDPFIQFALYAASEAITDSGLDCHISPHNIGMVVGNSLGGVSTSEMLNKRALQEGVKAIGSTYLLSTMGNMASGNIAIELGVKGPTYTVGTACASGTDAIGIAKNMIEKGQCDFIIAGASEAPITPLVTASFTNIGALSRNRGKKYSSRPFDEERDGFVISEGAAFLVLEDEEKAIKRKARIYATVTGYWSTNDSYHVTSPSKTGEGILKAMKGGLTNAGLAPSDIDCINAHGTSTQYNDYTEGKAISRIFGEDVFVTSTKGVTGHSLAASGAIESAISILKINNKGIPAVAGLKNQDRNIKIKAPTTSLENVRVDNVLSNSLGFGGQNATLVFSRHS
ncbi:beta-ketoacyl-[acyl-carrier-protein] synthase family protein [Chromohalobacter salexigens]|nr:beta-ketoacyl-[acyl-carrier-protein] synthase family protein [Chromohalobacter salexigens]